MCTEHRDMTWTLLLLLLLLLCLSGALCSEWKVEYQQQNICAVKGSSVVFPCSFSHPGGEKVQRVMWGHERNSLFTGPFIFDSVSLNTSLRFRYIGDKDHNCSLSIDQVEHNDAGKYAFRFQTNSEKGLWTGKEGSRLKIVDLKAVATGTNRNGTTKEGDSVNLTCINSCDGGDLSSAFTWFKNGEPLTEGPVLYLSNISSTHSGNYTCSLTTHTRTTSGVISIDVEYGPKNTSVSVRPSTEEGAGSNVALICSSRANPPVENYTWFKIHGDGDGGVGVGNEPELHLRAGKGQYMCNAANKHGSQNSSIVALKVKEHSSFTRDGFIAAVVTVLLVVTTVMAVRKLRLRKSTRAAEADRDEDAQDAVYVNLPAFNDRNQCEGATVELIYAAIDFNAKRESNMQQQMDPHNDDEGVIYSTVSRCQIVSPSYIEPL